MAGLNRKSKVNLESEPVLVTNHEVVIERSENFVPVAHFINLDHRQTAPHTSTSTLAEFGGVQERSEEKVVALNEPSPNVTSAMMKT